VLSNGSKPPELTAGTAGATLTAASSGSCSSHNHLFQVTVHPAKLLPALSARLCSDVVICRAVGTGRHEEKEK